MLQKVAVLSCIELRSGDMGCLSCRYEIVYCSCGPTGETPNPTCTPPAPIVQTRVVTPRDPIAHSCCVGPRGIRDKHETTIKKPCIMHRSVHKVMPSFTWCARNAHQRQRPRSWVERARMQALSASLSCSVHFATDKAPFACGSPL